MPIVKVNGKYKYVNPNKSKKTSSSTSNGGSSNYDFNTGKTSETTNSGLTIPTINKGTQGGSSSTSNGGQSVYNFETGEAYEVSSSGVKKDIIPNQSNIAQELLKTPTTKTISGTINKIPSYYEQQQVINSLQNFYQSQINSGRMSYEDAKRSYERRANEYANKYNTPTNNQPKKENVYSPIERKKGLAGVYQRAEEKQSILSTSLSRGEKMNVFNRAELIGLTAGVSITRNVIGSFNFGKGLVTQPITTIKNIPAGFKSYAVSIGQTLKTGSPEEIVGRAGGEIAFNKLQVEVPNLIIKGSDIIRTSGLKEIPKENIIAPEYFKGQKYPQIYQGQTAGELLEEFKSKDYFTGLTASPKSFSKITEVKAGTSELSGLYQAPKLSPAFLKITGEEQSLFSLNPFKQSFKPTTAKVTPLSFELIEGVSYSQRTLTPLSKAQKFYGEKAQLGKSYIPFIKTEKEAIIPAGTPIKRTGINYYFKFEGRRIPIMEYKIDTAKLSISSLNKNTLTAGKLSEVLSSSSNKVGKTSYFTSLDVYSSFGKSSYLKTSNLYSTSNINLSSSKTYPTSNLRINTLSSSGKVKRYSSKRIISNVSYGNITPYKPIISPISSISSSSIIKPPIYKTYPSTRKITPYKPRIYPIVSVTSTPKTPKDYKMKNKGVGSLFGVSVRRKGKFIQVGKGLTLQKALSVGKFQTQGGLGQTFKITGKGSNKIMTPTGFYKKKTNKGILFIETPKSKINTRSEIKLLSNARRLINK